MFCIPGGKRWRASTHNNNLYHAARLKKPAKSFTRHYHIQEVKSQRSNVKSDTDGKAASFRILLAGSRLPAR
jgi:hypothetical protein